MTTSTINGKPASTGLMASAFLGGGAAICLLIVWGGFWTGLALSMLWGWFIVPVFGLPVLSIAQAYGIALVVACVASKSSPEKDQDGFGTVLVKAFIRPPLVAAFVLLAGYIVKAWV